MTHYRDGDFLPNALLNYMALLGWNPGTEKEIFTLDGLVEAFDISKVQKGGAIFNEEKLRWINKEHIKLMSKDAFIKTAKNHILSSPRVRDLGWNVTLEIVGKIMPVLVDRINTFGDIEKMIMAQDFDYYFVEPVYDALSLKWKEEKDLESSVKHLTHIKSELGTLSDKNWNEDGIKAVIWPYAEKEGRGSVLWPFRFSLSGRDKSPNPFTLAVILGKEMTLKRIDTALTKCAKCTVIS